ncbi:MAG: hypothetical protein QM760_15980 [Nibricoccus sp.]
MKKPIAVGVSLAVLLLVAACHDRKAEEKRAKDEAEEKARAEAARKEMDALPKAFGSEPFFKRNKPEKKSEPRTETSPPKS